MRWFVVGVLAGAVLGCTEEASPPGPSDVPLTGTLPPRPTERSCHFDGHPPGVLPEVTLEPVVLSAELEAPIAMAPVPNGSSDVFVLERDGSIWRVSALGEAPSTATKALDTQVTIAEALSFHTSPSHPEHVVVASRSTAGVLRVSRYTFDASAIDVASERVLLTSTRADRAALSFDADGLLYVALADGTGDPAESTDAQNHATAEGTLLRIDISTVDATGTYAVPPDNPLATAFGGLGGPVATWVLGVRSPSACTMGPDRVWCSDLGIEVSEIHRAVVGRDFGWPDYDGSACLLPADCPLALDRFPQATVPREAACGVVGLATYRGGRYASLAPSLVYGNSCDNSVHVMLLDAPDDQLWHGALAHTAGTVTGVGTDAEGEVFVLTTGPSQVLRLVVPAEAKTFPDRLSASGCFTDVMAQTANPGVIPYDVNAPLWSDGSEKGRWVELPPGETISVRDDGSWVFPVGTVMLKSFSYDVDGAVEPVEMRVMILRAHGWEFHSYRYDGTDAYLLDDSEEQLLSAELTHGFPSRGTCTLCHRVDPARVLGVRADQLNRITTYADGPNEQLVAWEQSGMFDHEPSLDERMAQPANGEHDLEARARAYLHTNCGHCHQPGGWVPSELPMDLRYDTAFADTLTCDVPARYGTSATLIVPGDPDASRLLARIQTRGNQQMPPIATELIDADGAHLVETWIAELRGCP